MMVPVDPKTFEILPSHTPITLKGTLKGKRLPKPESPSEHCHFFLMLAANL